MGVIGRGRQGNAQNATTADGCRDVALLAGPVGVMSSATRREGNWAESWTVVPTRLFRPSRSMRRYQNMSLWPNRSSAATGNTDAPPRAKDTPTDRRFLSCS